jgi:hypothetical protein
LKKEHKKSSFALCHILFEVPSRAGELGIHSGRYLFPEVVAFHSTVGLDQETPHFFMDVVVSFLVRSGQRRMVNSVAKSHVEKTGFMRL